MITTLPLFLDYLVEQDRSELTVSSYKSDLIDFMNWFEKSNQKPAQSTTVTPLDLRAYRNYMQKERQLKPSSVNRHLAALRSYFNWAYDTGRIVSNPTIGIKSIRSSRRAPKWLNRSECFALLRTAAESIQLSEVKELTSSTQQAVRDQAIVALLLHAGLRVSELCALQLPDVKIRSRSGWVIIRFGKGRKYREVPLNKDCRKAVDLWLSVRPLDEQDYLFTGRRNSWLKPRGVQRLVKKLAEKARLGDKQVTPHTLRHTFGKNLVDTGVSLDRVAMLLGHESLDTTAIYTTPSRADLAAAVEQIAWQD